VLPLSDSSSRGGHIGSDAAQQQFHLFLVVWGCGEDLEQTKEQFCQFYYLIYSKSSPPPRGGTKKSQP
jgi:hypothetical protein